MDTKNQLKINNNPQRDEEEEEHETYVPEGVLRAEEGEGKIKTNQNKSATKKRFFGLGKTLITVRERDRESRAEGNCRDLRNKEKEGLASGMVRVFKERENR